jgi:hypothetical protein
MGRFSDEEKLKVGVLRRAFRRLPDGIKEPLKKMRFHIACIHDPHP